METFSARKVLSLRGGRILELEYRISSRAKRMRLTLQSECKAVITLPEGCSCCEAQDFLKGCIPWLERMCATLEEKRKSSLLPDGERKSVPAERMDCFYPRKFSFPAFGMELEIAYQFRDVCWCGVREIPGNILLASGCVTDPFLVRDSLCDYLKRKGTCLFESMLQRLSMECSIPFSKLTVRMQKGRWGSCSSRGNISLNAEILFFPEEALRYVMIHELCHLRHMDHSVRFWREVEQYCKDYKRIRQQIRRGIPSMWIPPGDL